MEYTFSKRVQNLKPSAIREILKYSSDPNVIPLAAGNPAPEAFPVDAISEISSRIFKENPIARPSIQCHRRVYASARNHEAVYEGKS